jgi:hypothetical protein
MNDGGGWPKPVDEFLKDAHLYLNRCDVVLCSGTSLYSRLIRWATKSRFSHAAVVFLIPDKQQGFDNTFILESNSKGVDLTNLRHYLVDKANSYDIAIKRLEAKWFDVDVRKQVRGHMLNFIKAKYDFRTLSKLGRTTLRRILFGIQRLRRKSFEDALLYTEDQFVPSRFICSGFVQYGFCATVERLEHDGKLPAGALQQVAFKEGVSSSSDGPAILSTTPADLEKSDKLNWKYVAVQGQVHRVTGEDEASRLFARARS